MAPYIHSTRYASLGRDLLYQLCYIDSTGCVTKWLAGCAYLPNAIRDHGGRH